jgi:hypothetical protein
VGQRNLLYGLWILDFLPDAVEADEFHQPLFVQRGLEERVVVVFDLWQLLPEGR